MESLSENIKQPEIDKQSVTIEDNKLNEKPLTKNTLSKKEPDDQEPDDQEPEGQYNDGQEPDVQEPEGQEPDDQESEGQEPDDQEPDDQDNDEDLNLQLGDVIEIKATDDPNLNNKRFYIKYIDDKRIHLVIKKKSTNYFLKKMARYETKPLKVYNYWLEKNFQVLLNKTIYYL